MNLNNPNPSFFDKWFSTNPGIDMNYVNSYLYQTNHKLKNREWVNYSYRTDGYRTNGINFGNAFIDNPSSNVLIDNIVNRVSGSKQIANMFRNGREGIIFESNGKAVFVFVNSNPSFSKFSHVDIEKLTEVHAKRTQKLRKQCFGSFISTTLVTGGSSLALGIPIPKACNIAVVGGIASTFVTSLWLRKK
jgi:hypothetical protein